MEQELLYGVLSLLGPISRPADLAVCSGTASRQLCHTEITTGQDPFEEDALQKFS